MRFNTSYIWMWPFPPRSLGCRRETCHILCTSSEVKNWWKQEVDSREMWCNWFKRAFHAIETMKGRSRGICWEIKLCVEMRVITQMPQFLFCAVIWRQSCNGVCFACRWGLINESYWAVLRPLLCWETAELPVGKSFTSANTGISAIGFLWTLLLTQTSKVTSLLKKIRDLIWVQENFKRKFR